VLLLAVFGAVGFAALAWGDGPADPSRTGGGAAVGAAGVTGDGHAGHSLATGAAGAPDWAAATAFGTGLAMWLLMVVAMMLPTTVPLVRYVATATRRSRRQRSILLFAAGHVAAWAPAALLVGVWAMVVPHGQVPRWLAAAALATAGGWELTRWKRRALRRCHRTRPVRFCGRAADVSAARLGLANGRTCVLAWRWGRWSCSDTHRSPPWWSAR